MCYQIVWGFLVSFSFSFSTAFSAPTSSWTSYLSRVLDVFVENECLCILGCLNVVTSDHLAEFSLRQAVLSQNQPFIDWSPGLLGTNYGPVDRQHQWLLTLVNISFDS